MITEAQVDAAFNKLRAKCGLDPYYGILRDEVSLFKQQFFYSNNLSFEKRVELDTDGIYNQCPDQSKITKEECEELATLIQTFYDERMLEAQNYANN